jgi:hypothetical protein
MMETFGQYQALVRTPALSELQKAGCLSILFNQQQMKTKG